MKKIFFIILILFVLSGTIYASPSNKINVKIDNKSHTVSTVPIMVDNQELASLVPSFLLKDRTLVPIRFISEHYGMNVGWDDDTKKITLDANDLNISLQINSQKVVVNGEGKELDNNSTPRLVVFPDGDARTMVPLRFISEVLKYKVDWDGDNLVAYVSRNKETVSNQDPVITNPNSSYNEVIGFNYSSTDKSETFVLMTSKPCDYIEKFEDGILSLKLKNTRDGVYAKDYYNAFLANVNSHLSGFEVKKDKEDPNTLLCNFIFKEEVPYNIQKENDLLTISINEISQKSNAPLNNPTTGVNVVITDILENNPGFRIKGAGGANYNILTLENPNRYILDIMNADFNGIESKTYGYSQGYITNVRASQFSPDKNYKPDDRIVRVVFDIKEDIDPYLDITMEGEDLIVAPKASIWNLIKVDKERTSATLTLDLDREASYSTEFNPDSKEFIIHLPYDITDIPDENAVVGGVINSISLETHSQGKIMRLSFNRNVSPKVLSPSISNQIVIKAERIFTSSPSDYLVFIDPGHGGVDPGTSGVSTGTFEKTLNLNVALLVRERLKSMGYQVIMSREDDTYIGTYERPKMANNVQADVFVSIHANFIDGKSHVKGIEAFYYAPNELETNRADQKYLMQYIYEEAANRTGFSKRRTANNIPYIVIRYTTMPAMLIEMGFMSNAEEEKRLLNPTVQAQFAEAIAIGIDRYIKDFR